MKLRENCGVGDYRIIFSIRVVRLQIGFLIPGFVFKALNSMCTLLITTGYVAYLASLLLIKIYIYFFLTLKANLYTMKFEEDDSEKLDCGEIHQLVKIVTYFGL